MDIQVAYHGSVVIITGRSDSGREYLDERMPEDAPLWGRDGYVVESRYAPAIIEDLLGAGMDVA